MANVIGDPPGIAALAAKRARYSELFGNTPNGCPNP